MKRWRQPLILIALLLLAGAVVNVAVAWGIAARASSGDWLTFAWYYYHWGEGTEASGRGWLRIYRSEQTGPAVTTRSMQFESGWPMRALVIRQRVEVHSDGSEPVPDGTSFLMKGALAPKSMRYRFAESNGYVPLAPTVGFAMNTLFYATLLAPVAVIPLSVFPIRRRLRARRGRCPKCGYDLAGLGSAGPAAPCPECGATR